MGDLSTKLQNRTVPSIEITLTTFSDDENGELSGRSTGIVKIDGEGETPQKNAATGLHFCSFTESEHVKNLLVLSFGQFLLWMAFDTLSGLQSAINEEQNMGQMSLAVMYGAVAVSSFLLPTAVMKKLGCKRTIVYSTIGFSPYILANFYSTWWTMIPSAVLTGSASGILWCARSVYLNRISQKYAGLHRYSFDISNALFFSVYTVFKQNTEIWGSLMSYYVLRSIRETEVNSSTAVITDATASSCGAEFCGDGPVLDLHFPPQGSRFILMTTFAALSLISAFFLAFFLEPLEASSETQAAAEAFSINDLLVSLRYFRNLDHVLLIPLSVYIGLVDGFYSGDFKRVYIACAWGFPQVATVSICYGMVSVLIASASGPCVQILGRATLFILAGLAHLAMFLAMLLWKPGSEHTAGFFLIAAALGIGNGVWLPQLVAFYGVLFKESEEAGFSCFYFLNSLGFLLAYSYSSYFCTSIKIYIPLTILVIGLICYLAVEVRIVKKILVEYNSKRQN